MNGPEKPASALKKGTEKEVLSDSKMEPKINVLPRWEELEELKRLPLAQDAG